MRKVGLPFEVPAITGYVHHAHLLGILGQDDRTLPWLYSNYVQLYCYPDFRASTVPFNFYVNDTILDQGEGRASTVGFSAYLNSIPWLENERMSRNVFLGFKAGLRDKLTEWLRSGYYVLFYLNGYHIPGFHLYRTHRFAHQMLVIGYDLDEGTLELAEFKQERDGKKYQTFRVPMEAVEEAFYDVDLKGKHREYIYLVRFNADAEYAFDMDHVRNGLAEYLNGACTAERWRSFQKPAGLKYGMDVYDCLLRYLDRLDRNEAAHDIRPFHILWEHKILMMQRLQYMERNGYIDRSFQAPYEPVAEISGQLRLMMMVYREKKSGVAIQAMKQLLEDMRGHEKEALVPLAADLAAVR